MGRVAANRLVALAWEKLGHAGCAPSVCYVDRFPDSAQAYAFWWPSGDRWILLSRAALRDGHDVRELLAHEIAHHEVWLTAPTDMTHGPRWRRAYKRALRATNTEAE